MTDFKVLLNDLSSLASKYSNEAPVFEGIVEKLQVAPPNSGDETLNESMRNLIDELGVLSSKMASSLLEYADKINDSRNKYEITDDSDKNRFLWDNMTDGIK